MRNLTVVCLAISVSLLSTTSEVSGFTLVLDNGEFYGPGNALYNDTGIVGVNRFPDAKIKNIVLTGPLQGFIPFANNGAEEPNVIAEKLTKSGPVDGMASDGTLINENGDTALRLNFSDPTTGESADVMVIAERSSEPHGGETIAPDVFGNLTFRPNVVADPGDPALVARFNPVFTTGYVEIPLSLKTQMGAQDGVDNAGPFHTGHILVGRLGDYNQDGFLDGILVLADNAPLDLIVGRGNPIAQRRPWLSDIPISPDQAIYLTLSGLMNNYPYAFAKAQELNDIVAILTHLQNLDQGIEAILGNMRRVILQLELSGNHQIIHQLLSLRDKFNKVQNSISDTTSAIDKMGIRGAITKRTGQSKAEKISKQIARIFYGLKGISEELNQIIGS